MRINSAAPIVAIALLSLFPRMSAAAQDGEELDFSDQTTPVCQVVGLHARPPDGWFNVPIEAGDKEIRGCQMMRTREQDDALLGIARVVSVEFPDTPADSPWWSILVSLEAQTIERMGYTLGEVLWTREDVPIQGKGFSSARAIGFESRVAGKDTPQEVHFLVFENRDIKYVVTLLTPGESVDNGIYYERNVSDFGALIRGFTQPPAGAGG